MVKVTRGGAVAAALALAVAAVCIRLGFWQLQRMEQRRELNAALSSALERPPLRLRDSLAAVAGRPGDFQFRRVRLRGYFDLEREVVLRGRARGGKPGVHLVAPFRLVGTDTAVLVNRGWVPSPDAATLDPREYRGAAGREVEGILLPAPSGSGGAVPLVKSVGGTRVRTYQRLDVGALASETPYPLLPLYVQALPSAQSPADGGPLAEPLPSLDEGPHLGYAIQWFSFAAIAVLGLLGVMLFRGRAAARR